MRLKYLTAVAALFFGLSICGSVARATSFGKPSGDKQIEPSRILDDEDPGWDFEARIAKARSEEAALRGTVGVEAEHDIERELRSSVVVLQPWFGRHPRQARRIADIVYVAATEHGVDPHLALAWASRESGFRAGVRGSLNEQGLFQVMPSGDARRQCDPERRDLGQPRVNADVAMCYYDHLRQECGTDDPWVIAVAYGTGRCVESEDARRYTCALRKRAELCRSVGDERCATIWPA